MIAFQCTCDECVQCCHRRPGWCTPDEANELINQGHSKSLMLDWWVDETGNGHDIYMVVPAIVGYEGSHAPTFPNGTCAFLENNRCSIHDNKPTECSIAGCKGPVGSVYRNLRLDIVDKWNTNQGRGIVNKWKELCKL